MGRALGEQDAVLLVVDVQNDFCGGGALAVPAGEEVVSEVNRRVSAAVAGGGAVCASRDWHPPGHVSFRERGGRWPPHCVLATALDAVGEGFETHLLLRACRPVDVTPGDGDRAVDRMRAAGVHVEH